MPATKWWRRRLEGWGDRAATRLRSSVTTAVWTLIFGVRRHSVEILVWLGVWLLQWKLAPTWLVGSVSGLQTLGQSVAATIVAIFVLIVGSAYVLAQQAVSLYGSHAVVILMADRRVITSLLRGAALIVAALVVGAETPDNAPSHLLTAAAATVTLAACALAVSAVAVLVGGLGTYTAPSSFVVRVVDGTRELLEVGAVPLVAYKVPTLGEMARLTRGDSAGFLAALTGLKNLQDAYIDAAAVNPEATTQIMLDGSKRARWLGDDLAAALVRAGEEALKLGATESEGQTVARVLEASAKNAVRAKQNLDAHALVEAMINLATNVHQVRPETVNIWPWSAPALARTEREAEAISLDEVAVAALAGWALSVAYPVAQFATVHPSFRLSIADLGETPPGIKQGISSARPPGNESGRTKCRTA